MKRVLVTGSSRGIGAAIARRLAADGWLVAIHASGPSVAAEQIALELGAGQPHYADLSDPQTAGPLWESVTTSGDVHALVNNAGIYLPKPFLETSAEELHRTFAVNWESPFALSQAAARTFVAQGGGKILNVASRVGFRGEAGAAAYSASKAALINLTRALAVELARYQIGVFGIAPGWVETAMARDGMGERLPEILATLPLGRMASPDDCAASAAFLLSDPAAYLSGVVIDINGASYFH